jgi:hypothetical protein
MKKIIRLTESDLTRLIKRVINEDKKNYENQGMIDAILDKIAEFGMDSLTDSEKYVLKNPDEKPEYVEVEPTEEMEDDIITLLIYTGLIDENSMTQDEDNHYFLSDLIDSEGYGFRYFENGHKLELTTKPKDEELLIEFDPEAETNDVMELKNFIDENWGEAKQYIDIHFL